MTHYIFYQCTPVTNTKNSLIQNTIRPSIRHSYTSKQLKEICNHVKSSNLTNLPYGIIRTLHQLQLNKKSRKKGTEQEKMYKIE